MWETITPERAHELTVEDLEMALEALRRKEYKTALTGILRIAASISDCFIKE